MGDQELLKLLESNEQAIAENLLKSPIVESIKKAVLEFLDANLKQNSILQLRYAKFKTKPQTLWYDRNGYPIGTLANEYLKPWVGFFEQYLAEKTIKARLEDQNLFVETRAQGQDSDLHILVGKKDGTGEKAHITIDKSSAEIRVEDNRLAPEEVVKKIETILTLPDGRKIKTARGLIEEMEQAIPVKNLSSVRPIIDIGQNFMITGSSDGNQIGFQTKNVGSAYATDVSYNFTSDDYPNLLKGRIVSGLNVGETNSTVIFYNGTELFKKQLKNPRIIFSYRDAQGNSYTSGRHLAQQLRADGNYNIDSVPGDFIIPDTKA